MNQAEIFKLLYSYSYLILFPLVVVEGPVVSIISGFLVSLGFMSFIPTYIVLVLGDFIGDMLYYSAGRWWLHKAYKKILSYFKISSEKIERLEVMIKTNRGKTLFFGKLSHAIGGIVLIVAGIVKVPLDEFIKITLSINFPKSLVLILIGYFLGGTITNFKKSVDYTVLGFFIFGIIFLILYIRSTQISDNIVKKLEKENK